MPSVGRDLGGYAYFSWATAAYMAGAILSGATAARLSARFGLRRAMIAAALVAAAGCAASALAPGMLALVAGRLAQGLGAGWIVGACYAAIGAMFPERHLARIFGVMTGIWGVATVLGPMVGAAFAQGSAWRDLFWAFGAQCIAFLAAAAWLLPEDAPAASDATPWRQIGLVMAAVALVGAADLARSVGAALALCLASLAVFAWALRLRPSGGVSLFPPEAGHPTSLIGSAYLSYFALSGAAMGFAVYAPALLQRLFGLSPLVAGYAAGLESVGWTVAAIAVAGTAPRWHGLAIRTGAAAIVGALGWLAAVMAHGPVVTILCAATVLGAGFGLSSGLTGRRVIGSAPEDERAVASAGLNSVRQVGNASGACLAGIIANLLGMGAGMTLDSAEASAVWLFVLSLPLAVVGAAGAWRVGRASPSDVLASSG
jgi:MFS family permease